MSNLTPERLDQIEQTARKATPGPWHWMKPGIDYYEVLNDRTTVATDMLTQADAQHVANMDPETTLALIARARIAEYQVARLRKAIATFNEWCRDEEEKLRWPHREDLNDYANGWRKGTAQGEADAYAAAANIVRDALEKPTKTRIVSPDTWETVGTKYVTPEDEAVAPYFDALGEEV